MDRCSGDVRIGEIISRLQKPHRTLIVYDRLITANRQVTGGPDNVHNWMIKNKGDPRIKVMVFQQNHLYMVIWRDQEMSIKFLFKSPRTGVVEDRMAQTVHQKVEFEERKSLTRWMAHCPTCPCGSLLLNTLDALDALDGPLARESPAGPVSLWKVSKSLEQNSVASPRL